MARPRKADSNLFAIDYDAIEETLRDANAPLLKRRADLLAAFSRAPASLALDDDVIRARRFAGQLDAAIREARKARLSDGRPFRDAAARVKAFFDDLDKPLKEALQAMLDRLTEAAERSRPRPADAAISSPVPVGIDVSGRTIATAESPQSKDARAEIRLAWSIEGFDRAALDLEALRDYLTDAAILAACRKHLGDHGAQALAGVAYRQVAQAR